MATYNYQDHKQILSQLYLRPRPAPTGRAGKPGKSGRNQIKDNARDLLNKATRVPNVAAMLMDFGDCLESRASVDGRGRPVKSMRVRVTNSSTELKRDFKAYHVTWVAANSPIQDTTLQYSHRCHNCLCINDAHGTWESDKENKARNVCRGRSHLQLPNGALINLCKHNHPTFP